MKRCWIAVIAIVAGASALLVPSAARAAVPTPRVEGPIRQGSPTGGTWWATPYDLGPHGYVEREYFLSGVASDRGLTCPAAAVPGPTAQFPAASAMGCTPGGAVHQAPYKVRILIRQPLRRRDFAGTALLEWANVSLQMEIEHDWAIDAPTIIRGGMVSAMVSAQQIGVQGPGPFSLKNWAPARYGTLQQPGDVFSYDIYAQAARALRSGRLTDGLRPRTLIGSGTSQSCLYLTTYIPTFAAKDALFDAFMPTLCPAPASIPDNLVPILFGTSESEAQLDSRPDGPLLRVWEMPGSHINYYEASQGQAQLEQATGAGPGVWDERSAGQYGERGNPVASGLAAAGVLFNNTTPARYAFRAGLDEVARWARQHQRHGRRGIASGKVHAPPTAPRLARTGGVLLHDTEGNVVGGVPLPAIQVPVATYATESFGGETLPFDPARLLALYPTHSSYVDKMSAVTGRAVAAAFMLSADAREWMQRVSAARIGGVLGAVPAPGT